MLRIISTEKKLWTPEEKLAIINYVFSQELCSQEQNIYVHYNLGRGNYTAMQELFENFRLSISRETNVNPENLEFRISACTDAYCINITNPGIILGYLELDTSRAELYFIQCDKHSVKNDVALNFHVMVAYVPEDKRIYLEERGFQCRITRKG